MLHDTLRKKNQRPTENELHTALSEVLSLSSRVFLMFDALDECHNQNRHDIVTLLQRMERDGIFVFTTSRPLADIRYLTRAVRIELSAHKEDITTYLESRIAELRTRMPPAPPPLLRVYKEKVISGVRDSVGEMSVILSPVLLILYRF